MSDDRQRERSWEDEGMPPSDDNTPLRPSDEEEIPLPSDRTAMSHDRVTAREQLEREGVHTRAAREEPEQVEASGRPKVGRLVEETVDGADETAELVADEVDDRSGLTAEEAALRYRVEDEE